MDEAGTPAIYGEDVSDGTGGYHYYPDRAQVRSWLADASFALVAEADERFDGYSYHCDGPGGEHERARQPDEPG